MFETFDKIKKQAVSAGTNFVKTFTSKNIQPCDGAEYEYCGNDEDYNEFFKNVGSKKQDYVNIAEVSTEDAAPKSEKTVKTEKAEETVKKTLDNISDTIFDKFNQIKSSIEETKSSAAKEDFVKTQEKIEELSNEVKNISQMMAVLKLSTDELIKSSRSSSAEVSLSVEKLVHQIDGLTESFNSISGDIIAFRSEIEKQSADFEQLKNECAGLNKSVNALNADIADVVSNQQMSKNSILALAESFDALNKKITIGFVTLGIMTALTVVLQIVFNVL